MLKQLKPYHYATLILITLLLLACSNARYLAENESLYMGATVKVTDTFTSKTEKKALTTELAEAVRPKTNRRLFGIRFKLTWYNLAGPKKENEKGLRKWLHEKIGEPPVLGSDVNIRSNEQLLNNILQNYGYFGALTTGSLQVKKNKKSTSYFEIETGPRTFIRNVIFQKSDTSELAKDILSSKDKSLLKPGDPYRLQAVIDERLRIDNDLKNKGYYYFSPDYLLVDADTGIGNNQVDFTLKLKYNEMPSNAYSQYRINSVTVFPNYRLNNRSRSGRIVNKDTTQNGRRVAAQASDTMKFDDFVVVDRQHTYRPYVFYQAMQFSPGELYTKKDQNISLNRLVTLGAFKFVKNEFKPTPDTPAHLLDVQYLLTPYAKKAFNGEFGGFTENDSRGGVRGSVSWKNKNMLRGAELFTVKLSGSYEAQYGGGVKRPNEYGLSLKTSLNIPRFIIPFVTVKPSGMYIPRTIINAGYEYSARADAYQIHSFNLGYGYNWKEDIRKDHKLFPINITLVKTDTFAGGIDSSAYNLSNLIYNGIIFGPTYEYTFNSQADGNKRRSNYYFNGLLDLSGNIVGLLQRADYSDNPQKILHNDYAQYIKTQLDFRYYFKLNAKSSVAAHGLVGFGYAYGNSSALPNVKQFFAGGSSSLRGFPSRLVGPGTFNEKYLYNTQTFIQTSGDIKSEFSVEYRAKIYSFIEGGLFADAGNVWLLRDDPSFPGGKFSKSFYKEYAADMGVGLRLDFTILLLRLDFAIPVRKPWYPEGERWRFNDIRFGDPDWRRENLLFNLAIGYPF